MFTLTHVVLDVHRCQCFEHPIILQLHDLESISLYRDRHRQTDRIRIRLSLTAAVYCAIIYLFVYLLIIACCTEENVGAQWAKKPSHWVTSFCDRVTLML